MAESRLLDEDKDEWVYETMNKYSNLYMFDLEFPVDTLEVINESSLCISGLQNYSKKCELLQLCVPPKLLRSEDEEGLCKDRDFKILSGGYAQGKIQQIKAVQKSPDLIATSQDGYSGVVIYQVGDDDRATILEKHRLPTNNSSAKINGKSLSCMNDKIVLAAEPDSSASTAGGIILNEWNIDTGCSSTSSTSKSYHIWKASSTDFKPGSVSKLKSWDGANTSIFLTTNGTLALYDLRTGGETPSIFFHASKSPTNPQNLKPLLDDAAPVIFTFDCLPLENKIGVLDSCGGYETFDPRNVGLSSPSLSSSRSSNRCLLPEFSHLAGVYPNWFNIEYEQLKSSPREDVLTSRFIISGVKRECVPVFQEVGNDKPNLSADKGDSGSANLATNCDSGVEPVFSHDGHSKPVSHSIWHPVANDLVFSASVDAVLHAWQFIPEKIDKD